VDWIETIGRAIMAIPSPVRHVLAMPLQLIPSFRKADYVFAIERELARLEASGDYDHARKVRNDALKAVEPSFSAPLWRSQGFDLLRCSRSAEALEAFEHGISHLGDRASMYGVARPHELYYGAAVAALQAGESEKARGYYRHAANMITGIEAHLGTNRGWWKESLEALRRQLGEPRRTEPSNKPIEADAKERRGSSA
jgi:tetratricopeptide (TPR) repeat protein